MNHSNIPKPLPFADGSTGLKVLRSLAQARSPLAALQTMHQTMGDVFQITLPQFNPAVLVGPENNRHVLVSGRADFLWRTETDPVTRLLRHGLLVEDGTEHDRLRRVMEPPLYRRELLGHVEKFWQHTDRVTATWRGRADMLVEMRKLALLILMDTLFGVDFQPDLDRMWRPILKAIQYISPGLWILWPKLPRFGYHHPLAQLDAYLYDLIARRRVAGGSGDDLLGRLAAAPGFDDHLIRDQLLTMLIAGHDTSTALLAWVLVLLGQHPAILAQVQAEVDKVLGTRPPTADHLAELPLLDQIIKETLRLYPPIHLGNRKAKEELNVGGYRIPQNTRVMLSIYLSHRHPAHWTAPDRFCPHRFDRETGDKPPPLTYIPFGGGPRNCIGAAFAQVEAKIVLARLLQTHRFTLEKQRITAHMGATLEPHPGVWMGVERR
ncbi:MAG: cytochrome P450 [Anaerolineae bacterium]|nr:cytochrome P450 [Anaerolineae bacterium]